MTGYILPILSSTASYEKAAYFKGKAELEKQLAVLEGCLASRTFLVGQTVTLADVIVAWTLMIPYLTVRYFCRRQ